MKKILLVFATMLLLVGCTSNRETPKTPAKAGDEMRVHFLDVGQGDSIFIESPNGQTMLIDGGVKGSGQEIVAYLKEQSIEKLDIVVATHPDADHIGGLIPVLNSMEIGQFYDSGKVHTSQTFEEMLTLIDTKDIPFHVPKTGDNLTFDEAVSVKVVSADEAASDNNDASIVLKVTYGDVSFLLTGDAGVALEKTMLAQNVTATVLKAGHHGSNTSSSQSFIQAVQPKVTVLSYGEDNKYGHPHKEVVERLQAMDSKIYATAEAGTVIVSTNGIDYDVAAKEWSSSVAPTPTPSIKEGVEIISKDLENEIVAIQNNTAQAVDLKDWQLVSIEGNQVFNFPNMALQPNKIIYVTSGSTAREGQNYFKWTGRQIWLNDGDAAQLRNAKGEIVSELD
ncbi:MAG: MBL fold metallo-hydrolase [Lysinibacillus sp.]